MIVTADTPKVIEVITHPSFFDSKKPLLADTSTELMCSVTQARQKYEHNPNVDKYDEL